MIPYASSLLHEDRTVHYKKGKQLGDGFFIVEMSSTEHVLYITAVNVECAQSLILEIKGAQAKEYLSKFEYDFE